VVYLDLLVTHQFEGRRWTLPAQVYAAPLELYAGLALSESEMAHELERLHYRKVVQLERPGTYRVNGARLDVALRPAHFADENRDAQLLSIFTGPQAIESLRDAAGREVPVIRLEPLLIGSIFPSHGEDRIVLGPRDVPPLLPAALKAVEDRRFDSHRGVDPEAILRALWVDARAGQIEQGGSTLTQQLVRSYFLSSRQTLGRKLREAIMAIALDAHFTKDDLMNAYINEIFLGQDGNRAIHGFGLASQFYFGKPLGELDLSEVALLVAVVRGPSYYDPRRHPDRVLARRNLVLKELADQHVVTAAQAAEAARRPLGVTARPAGAYYPAYLDFVRRTLRRDYREEDLTEAGLSIYTSLDPRAQDAAEHALDRELSRLDHVAVWITVHVGSMGFFLLIAGWTCVWLLWNFLAPPRLQFDPPMAFVFWLFISNVIQILLMPLIMVGQNVLSNHAEVRAEYDLEVNVKAEREIEAILRHLEYQNSLLIAMLEKLGVGLDEVLKKGRR
jgi:penicillin-binding protein 1B